MVHRFKALLTRFQRDERGVFAVFFGLLALVLIATGGAVVDFTSIEQARTRAQNVLDSAALGLQPHVFDEPAKSNGWFAGETVALLEEQLPDVTIDEAATQAETNVRDGQLILRTRITVNTPFVSLVGIPNISATLISEATRKRLNLEIAMVLDNSGSMQQFSRMTELKKAAKLATDILFDYQATQPNVYVSIIPFTQYVNVGTANRSASWMSQTGLSSVSLLNFDDDDNEATAFKGWPTQNGAVDRWKLYDEFNNRPWRGCVEARVTPYDTTDDVPNNAVPDTMFQPVFAPDSSVDDYVDDTGGACTRVAPTWKWTRTRTGCSNNSNWTIRERYDNCNSNTSSTYSGTDVYGANVTSPPQSEPADNSLYSYYNTGDCTTTYTGGNGTYSRVRTCVYDFSRREYQERICKYKGRSFSGDGANSDCPNTAILPLNNTSQTVKDRIDAMVASGSTNIEQGTIWGFHSLSPTEPLTQGRTYDEATTKVLIIMTDGENNVNYQNYSSNNPYGVSSWTAWGYRSNKRLLTELTTPKDTEATSSQVIAEVNRRTVLACANAKKKPGPGIKVYTIGLSAPNESTKQMLRDCASPDETINGEVVKYAHFPTDSADLSDVFRKIAEQLSELRLAQ